jgi:hypothetical protein
MSSLLVSNLSTPAFGSLAAAASTNLCSATSYFRVEFCRVIGPVGYKEMSSILADH